MKSYTFLISLQGQTIKTNMALDKMDHFIECCIDKCLFPFIRTWTDLGLFAFDWLSMDFIDFYAYKNSPDFEFFNK